MLSYGHNWSMVMPYNPSSQFSHQLLILLELASAKDGQYWLKLNCVSAMIQQCKVFTINKVSSFCLQFLIIYSLHSPVSLLLTVLDEQTDGANDGKLSFVVKCISYFSFMLFSKKCQFVHVCANRTLPGATVSTANHIQPQNYIFKVLHFLLFCALGHPNFLILGHQIWRTL